MASCAPGPTAKPTLEEVPPPPDTSFARAVSLVGQQGMVVSAHPLASQVGMEVLQSGGNAADAAVAALGVLNVVEPHASGLGGGGFLLYYDAAQDSFYVLDYRERAPARLNKADYFKPDDTLHLVQRTGGSSVLTPGAPAGWQALHTQFGTQLLSELLAPAVSLADTGYPVSTKQSAMILDYLAEIQAEPTMSQIFLRDSLPLMPGDKLTQPQLAKTLKFLSQTRLENLYYSPYAEYITKAVAATGGTLSNSDLMSYRALDRRPLRGEYHGYEIITLPPPSSGGMMLLEILKLLEPYDLKSLGYLSADYIHTFTLAVRQALADGNEWIADPDYERIPMDALRSDEWMTVARSRMYSDSVPEFVTALDSIRAFTPGNTTHLVVVDSAGNLVSLTQSINYFFGSGVMVPELGLLLNNHMADFSSDSVSRTAMAPFHRPPSNMAATIVRKDGQPILVIGSPGGARIASVIAQVLVDVLDFGMPLDEALNAPRFHPARKVLVVETRIPQSTLDELTARGWRVYPYGSVNNYFGGVHAIQIDQPTGELRGAADPRRDGAPAGF
ncbi:MAG: gamma-glutamyltransferase [Calditrichota bacterium]